ncbi:MAG: hypothetical protein FWE93_05120 [Alphaproteobacteria bacterium]|nr:hypothetical protein [Alphaproteobacteria bacterium]
MPVYNSLVSSSVAASGVPAKFTNSASHIKNPSFYDSISIGTLKPENVIVSVSDSGQEALSSLSHSFYATKGYLSLSQMFDSYTINVFTRIQLFDSEGNVIADSLYGTESYAAFEAWQKGELFVEEGTYTVVATPNTDLIGDINLSMSTFHQQGTALSVNSSLNASTTAAYYNFSLSGTNLKFDFNAGKESSNLRVIIFDAKGTIVADSDGDRFMKAQYILATSGTGLSLDSGDYVVAVTYKNNIQKAYDVDYSFTLYSGSTYSAVYTTNASVKPYDPSAAGSVEVDPYALLYEAQGFNKFNSSPATAVTIGWLQQDKSMLAVQSAFNNAGKSQYYMFTLQQGDNIKFDFNKSITKEASNIRVQLLDATGLFVYADSHGTPEQQKAYRELTSETGLSAKPGKYTVHVSYLEAVSDNVFYEFGIYSGTRFEAQYKTFASPQTFEHALLSGDFSLTGSLGHMLSTYLDKMINPDNYDEFALDNSKLMDALKGRF